MKNNYTTLAGIIGALTVALGAFGAHALKDNIAPDTLDIYKTAVLYQFIHVLALLAVGVLIKFFPNKTMQWAGGLFVAGIVLFSGSLYALVFILNSGSNGLRWLGAITPLGGLCFIAGWLCLAFGAKKAA